MLDTLPAEHLAEVLRLAKLEPHELASFAKIARFARDAEQQEHGDRYSHDGGENSLWCLVATVCWQATYEAHSDDTAVHFLPTWKAVCRYLMRKASGFERCYSCCSSADELNQLYEFFFCYMKDDGQRGCVSVCVVANGYAGLRAGQRPRLAGLLFEPSEEAQRSRSHG